MKLVANIEELEIKRCYASLEFRVKCPKCQKLIHYNSKEENNYISYPKTNDDINIHLYCDSCDSDLYIPGKVESIKIELTLEEDKIEEQ